VRTGLLLMCADQHAVHERIRLEALERHVIDDLTSGAGAGMSAGIAGGSVRDGSHGGAQILQRRSLPGAWVMEVTAAGADLITRHLLHLETWGFAAQVHRPGNAQTGLVRVSVTQAPLVCGVQLSRQDLLDTVQQFASFGTDSAPLGQVIPPAVAHVLKYKACHGAVRFGDELSLGTCKEFVRLLAECRLPFQCAHGRPSIIPLAQLQR
jgi:DNA mismatch repair ATPase MutL